MKRFLPWFGFAAFVISAILLAKLGKDYLEGKAKALEAIRIEEEKEITRQEYTNLLVKSLKYGSFKFLIYDKLYSDSKITKKELKELNEIYDRISIHDQLNLILQEKGIHEESEGQE